MHFERGRSGENLRENHEAAIRLVSARSCGQYDPYLDLSLLAPPVAALALCVVRVKMNILLDPHRLTIYCPYKVDFILFQA